MLALTLLLSQSVKAEPDLTTVRGTVTALYNVISGPAGEKRDWDLFRSLFDKDAKMIVTGTNAAGTEIHLVWTPDYYVTRSGPVLEQRGFVEREIKHVSHEFESIATVFSTYETRMGDTTETTRGINAIQLTKHDGRWWVQVIAWRSEDSSHPIPPEFLPGIR
ncbi:MAG: hypothetical protein KF812_00985 [Fimbriimonadaceae bacterium]|nr:hypothetical protein [Fimbriimonadaceae bacterium]